MVSIPTCGAVIFNDQDKVLLVEHVAGASHLSGTFGLPSGKIEPGESIEDATVREVHEETGLEIAKESLKKLPTLYHARIQQKDGVKDFSWEVFVARVVSGDLVSSAETRPQWVALDSLESLNLLPNVKNAILEAKGLS